MSRQLSDLEAILQGLIDEHRRLLGWVESHQAAMRSMDLRAMDDLARQQDASRLRLASLEARRKAAVLVIAKASRVSGELTLPKIAAMYPQRRDALMKLRDELKSVAQSVANRSKVASRVASAVLGHLNTAVRILAGAVERAGVYTKSGTPHVSRRIGVMEAVG